MTETKHYDKDVPVLNEFLLNTATKYHQPVCVTMRSGKEYIGVIKGYNFNKGREITLYKPLELAKMMGTFKLDEIESVVFVEKIETEDDSPTPF